MVLKSEKNLKSLPQTALLSQVANLKDQNSLKAKRFLSPCF